MRKITCISSLIVGTCGLLLAAGGPAFAESRPALAPTDGGDDGGVFANFGVNISCPPGVRFCANGPVYSGNLKNSQNSWWKVSGPISDSGSPNNFNASTNAHAEVHGPQGPRDNPVYLDR